jgi:hypothetical protein
MKSEIRVIQEKFTRAEAKIVQAEIRMSPDIVGYSYNELLKMENVFKAYCVDEFVGSCTNFDFGRNWTELSAFIVREKFRGSGVGSKLFSAAWIDAEKRAKHIFILSRNPSMVKIFLNSGMTIINSFRHLPAQIKAKSYKPATSSYRFKEFIRKLPMKKSGKFIFGVKLAKF